MKTKILFLFLFLTGIGLAQNLESIIYKGDLEKLKKLETKNPELIHEYLDVKYVDNFDGQWDYVSMHPMAYAAEQEHIDIVAYYIEKKETFGGEDWFRDVVSRAFILAISTGNQNLINLLYGQNPDLNVLCESCFQRNALMVATAYGDEKWYFELKDKSNLAISGEDENNLLHLAANRTSERIFFDVLAQRKSDINKKNNFGLTPLDIAAKHGNVIFFMELINAGADILIAEHIWNTIAEGGSIELFEFAVKYANLDYIILADGYLNTPLHTAMMFNQTEMTRKIVEMTILFYKENKYDGIDPDTYSINEVHPLYWAIDNNNKETFEAYIKFASNVYLATDDEYIVPIYDNLYKSAKKAFGKAFVEEMYETYEIVEI